MNVKKFKLSLSKSEMYKIQGWYNFVDSDVPEMQDIEQEAYWTMVNLVEENPTNDMFEPLLSKEQWLAVFFWCKYVVSSTEDFPDDERKIFDSVRELLNEHYDMQLL